MPNVVWSHANYSHSTGYYKSEIDIFNQKCIDVGLIPDEGNLARIDAITSVNFSVAASAINICYIEYTLPIGDGSINTVLSEIGDYETILSESYDTTFCKIRITISLYRINSSASSLLNICAMPSTTVSLYDSSNILLNSFASNYTYDGYNTSSIYTSAAIVVSSPSFIHLSGNTLHISFMNVKRNIIYGTSGSQNSAEPDKCANIKYNTLSTHICHVTIYRNKGIMNVVYPNHNEYTGSIGYNASFYPTGVGSNDKSKINSIVKPLLTVLHDGKYTYTRTHEYFIQSGLNNFSQFDPDGISYVIPTYINVDSDIDINPSVFRTTIDIPLSQSESTQDIILDYKGKKIKMRYINYGAFTECYKTPLYSNMTTYGVNGFRMCNYLYLFNDHPCTTEHVGV